MAQEKNFENRVKKYLETVGVYKMGEPFKSMAVSPVGYYEKRFANMMTGAGRPDMLIVINGRALDVEIKAPHGRASVLQNRMIEQINRSGCRACILFEHPEDFPRDADETYISFAQFKAIVRSMVHGSV